MTEDKANLVDKCLIATPAIKDPLFASSLVYICEHSKDGTMGLVVNHQTSQTLEDIFIQLNIECLDEAIKQQPVFIGGTGPARTGFRVTHHYRKLAKIGRNISWHSPD